jgi:hypothetical protein
MTLRDPSVFQIDPRGEQPATWATVSVTDGRALLSVTDATVLELTQFQTLELAGWLMRRLHVT